MTEKLPGVKRRRATAFVLVGAALLSPLTTACEGGDSLPPDHTESATGECTSKLTIHGMLPKRQDGQAQSLEITISKPRNPAKFEGYVIGYELPKDESGDWHASDLQLSDNKYEDGRYVVNLGKKAAALAVWTQSTGSGGDCDFRPHVEWGDPVPANKVDQDLPVVTWQMRDEI